MLSFVIDHRRVYVNGVHLHVASAREGPPVLLLHGFPEFWYSWRKQMGPLVEAGFSVLAPDLRGYSESDKPKGIRPYVLDVLIEDVVGLIASTGAGKAHLVGHDWGASSPGRARWSAPRWWTASSS